ncbi:hypothetical protein FQA39_LY10218 [Lamprigera yunnana]|nr:hypothetical protein FQA39_LY10218 [Lamprigera yunnana]
MNVHTISVFLVLLSVIVLLKSVSPPTCEKVGVRFQKGQSISVPGQCMQATCEDPENNRQSGVILVGEYDETKKEKVQQAAGSVCKRKIMARWRGLVDCLKRKTPYFEIASSSGRKSKQIKPAAIDEDPEMIKYLRDTGKEWGYEIWYRASEKNFRRMDGKHCSCQYQERKVAQNVDEYRARSLATNRL